MWLRNSWRNLIKSESTQDIPGRHLPGVVIANEAARFIAIACGACLGHMLLGLIRGARVVVQIGDMMTRLVALIVQVLREEIVQL